MGKNKKTQLNHEEKEDKSNNNNKLQIWIPVITAIITAIVTLVVAYWQFVWKPTHDLPPTATPGGLNYIGRIVDSKNLDPIKAATVELDIPGELPLIVYTDNIGVYHFSLNLEEDKVDARVRVDVQGYQKYDRFISISKSNPIMEEIHLDPILPSETAGPTATLTLVPTTTETGTPTFTPTRKPPQPTWTHTPRPPDTAIPWSLSITQNGSCPAVGTVCTLPVSIYWVPVSKNNKVCLFVHPHEPPGQPYYYQTAISYSDVTSYLSNVTIGDGTTPAGIQFDVIAIETGYACSDGASLPIGSQNKSFVITR